MRLFRRVVFVLVAPLAVAAVIPVAAGASVLAGDAGQAGPTASAAWGKAEEVPGSAAFFSDDAASSEQVTSISCASAGNCAAAGYYAGNGDGYAQPFVASQVGGTWRKAALIPGMLALSGQDKNFVYAKINSISCASAGNCAAVGEYNNASDGREAFVADEVNGTWHEPEEVPGTAGLNVGNEATVVSVSCASAGNCSAGGMYSSSPGHQQAFVVDEVHGIWRQAMLVPGSAVLNQGQQTEVTSVACSSPGNCTAGGNYAQRSDSPQYEYSAPFVVSEAHGKWGTAQEAPGHLPHAGFAVVSQVSCASGGNCTAAGYAIAPGLPIGPGGDPSGPERPFAVSQVRGTWHKTVAVPLPGALRKKSARINAISCRSAGNCSAGGSGGPTAIVASQVHGTWHTAAEVPGLSALNKGGFAQISALSCSSPGTCSAGGLYLDSHHRYQAFVVSQADSRWGTAREVAAGLNSANNGGLTALSCSAGGRCSAGGYYFSRHQYGFVMSRS